MPEIMKQLKQLFIFTLSSLCVTFSSITFAQSTDKIKSDLQKTLGVNMDVKSVSAAPVPGLYEVIINNNLVYTDTQGKFLIQGDIVEIKTGTNLTEIRQNELSKIRWSDLPLQNAIKVVKGNGTRKVAVFADPNCGYCKRLEKTFTEVDNLTVYTFLMPILSPDSTLKSKQIWCASDPSKAWVQWMVNNTAPNGKIDCSNPLDKNLALAKSLNINGTPAIFFVDGTRIPGAASKDSLEKKLVSLR